MRSGLPASVLFALAFLPVAAGANVMTTVREGSWSDPLTWGSDRFP